MKTRLILFYIVLAGLTIALPGCKDNNALIDENVEIANHNWTYINRAKFTFKIDDEKSAYNLYLNLRVTGDYKYSNIFVLVIQNGPGIKNAQKRVEIPLATKEGEWLGKGSGNLYSYQYPFLINHMFPAKGTYTFIIEQNMRDNPLREVSDVGLRVEKTGGK